jgi:hypothetical protein
MTRYGVVVLLCDPRTRWSNERSVGGSSIFCREVNLHEGRGRVVNFACLHAVDRGSVVAAFGSVLLLGGCSIAGVWKSFREWCFWRAQQNGPRLVRGPSCLIDRG